MIGILSGFGAVNCPFAYFQFISMNSKFMFIFKFSKFKKLKWK